MDRETQTAQRVEATPGVSASDTSATEQADGIGPAGEQAASAGRRLAGEDAPGQLGPVAAGLGVGVLAGVLARSRSEGCGEQESSALRAAEHATAPFFVAASMLADRVGPRAAVPLRGGLLGAHLVHMGEIARLLRAHGTGEPLIRAELAGGSRSTAWSCCKRRFYADPCAGGSGPRRPSA